jgi:hypothetical protein
MTDELLDQADPSEVLAAYLRVHAQGAPVPSVLFARGEAVYERLRKHPPATADWGRFLVAQGALAAEHSDDRERASRYFRAALESVATHGDNDVAVTAAYNQGVILEREVKLTHAATAYRTAANEGFRLKVATASTLRAALASIRLLWSDDQNRDLSNADRGLLKQTWLLWLWLRFNKENLPNDLVSELRRSLAAFLLPEDDPTSMAAHWRALPPHRLEFAEWSDGDKLCLVELYRAAVEAAEEHLRDGQPDPSHPYRVLLQAVVRSK